MKKVPMGVQVLLAIVIGALLGSLSKPFGLDLKVLGDAFIRLIEMSILPLVFPLIVLGIARMESLRSVGRIAGKTILYFEVVTTVILLVGIVLADLTGVGTGTNLVGANGNSLHSLAQGIDFKTFLLNIIPNNIFSALSQGNLLSMVFFGLFFGLAMAKVAEKAAPVANVLESLSEIMFTFLNFVVRFSPLGVLGFVAYDVANYGLSSLKLLGEFVLVAYVGFLVILLVILPITALIFRVRYFALLRQIWDLLLLAFTTRSSEVVLAPLMERLNQFGIKKSIVSFVLPVGYSFNLDGATMYEAIAVLFLAHAYHIDLSLLQQFTVVGTLMILTKGLAGVPSAAVVVLLTTAKAIGIPVEGVALLMGVDFIVDMMRTAVNVVGNSLAALIIGKSEKALSESDSDAAPAEKSGLSAS